MATAELTRTAGARRLPDGLRRAWLSAYAAIWMATLGAAALIAVAGTRASVPVHQLLGLRLQASRNPPPHIGHVLALATHNLRIAAWPLLLGVIGAHRNRLARQIADTVLLACITVNTLPVGAALGAYGAPLLAYIPQLPLEWAGLALGASAWLLQRRRALSVGEGLALFALIAAALLCAATVECVAVPHRDASGVPERSSVGEPGSAAARVRFAANCECRDYPWIAHSSSGHG
jgi:hypothetical protein